MSFFLQDGVLNWALVAFAVYLVVVLIFVDVTWRVSRISGKLLLLIASGLTLLGIAALWMALR